MKLLFYMMSLLAILMTVVSIKAFEKDTFLVIRSIHTHYQLIDGSSFYVSLYASQIADDLLHTEIDRTRLLSDHMSFDVAFEDMIQNHQETYMSRIYFHYEIHMTLPYFFESMYLENVYLEITTINDQQHIIQLGKMNITPYVSTFSHAWDSIYGVRHETIMTLISIIIETQEDIDVMMLEGIEYSIIKHPSHIEIKIESKHAILMHPIILISTSQGDEMIAGIPFISSKRMLIQTEGFHYVYALY
jgi:hypothetical protein